MEDEATQPSTQFPGTSLEDVETFKNVLCLLIPESSHAKAIVRLLYLKDVYSVLACTINNDEPFKTTPNRQFDTVEEKAAAQGIEIEHLALALRVPPDGIIPEQGFTFGRNFRQCDVCLGGSIKLSNVHFSIGMQPKSGALVLKDMSMNGTTVDGVKLRGKSGKDISTRTLQNGSKIELFEADPRDYISFNVRLLSNHSIASEYSTFTTGANANGANAVAAGRALFPNGGVIRKDIVYFGKQNEYQALEFIGQGSFAVVWKAVQRSSGALVAIKQIKKRGPSVNKDSIRKEVTIMERLEHPNIVKYFDCLEDADHMNICLELIEYGDLRDFTGKYGKFSESQVQIVTTQMLEAVEYLHSQGVTHRDLKPENILVSSADPLQIKITDFGLAKLITNDQSFLKTFCGTMLYLAPEAFPAHMQPNLFASPAELTGSKRKRPVNDDPTDRKRGKHNIYGQSVDMWAVGCIVYLLMTGRHPFEIGDKDEILQRVHTGKFDKDLLMANSASPVRCVDFMSRLIELNPALRISETEALRHKWLRPINGSPDSDEMYDLAKLSQDLLDQDIQDHYERSDESYSSDDIHARSAATAIPPKDSMEGVLDDDLYSDGEILGDSAYDFDSFEKVEHQSQSQETEGKMLVNFGGSSELLPSHLQLPSTGSGSIFVTPDSGPRNSEKSDTQMKSAMQSVEPKESIVGQRSIVDDDSGKSIGLCLSTGENLGHSGLPSMPGMPHDISSDDSGEVIDQSNAEHEASALKEWTEEHPSQAPDFVKPSVTWGRLIPLPGATEGTMMLCSGSHVMFGRSDKAQVHLRHGTISRRHAAITITDPTVDVQPHPPVLNEHIIAHINTRANNNVYLNGEVLPKNIPCRIFHGDQLVLLDDSKSQSFIGFTIELRIGQHDRPEGAPNIIPRTSRCSTPTRSAATSGTMHAGVSLATTV